MERARLILPKFMPGQMVRTRHHRFRFMTIVRKELELCESCRVPRWLVSRPGEKDAEVYCESILEVDA